MNIQNSHNNEQELTVIQKLYDYIKWVSPLINRLPKDRKFTIGDRLLNKLYNVLELLIEAKYSTKEKRKQLLIKANINMEIIRFYNRLLKDENLWSIKRYQFALESVNEVGVQLGGWIRSNK